MQVTICRDPDGLLSAEAYKVYAPCMYEPTFEKYMARMERYLSDPAVSVYICTDNGALIGMLVLDKARDPPEIAGIAVSESSRRKGAGRFMIERVTACEGLDSLYAQTDGDAVGFYRSCGFSVREELKEYPDGAAVRYHCFLELRARENQSCQ